MTDRVKQRTNERNLFLNRYFNLLLSVFVILILVVSYSLILGPKYESAQVVVKENLVNQQLLYNQQRKKLDTLKVISEIYNKIPKSDIEKLNSVLPYEYKAERLYGEIEEIVLDNGWTLDSVAISYPDEEQEGKIKKEVQDDYFFGSLSENVGRVELSLSLSGVDYLGAKRLLSVLESNLRLFDVKSFDFSGQSKVDLVLVTYYYRVMINN